jgi:hypothetical protein
MKKFFVLSFVLFFAVAGFVNADTSEEEAVKKAVVEGYIEGIFLKGDADLVKKRWHEECEIVVFKDGELDKIPVTRWIEHLEEHSGPLMPDIKVTYEFDDVKVVGSAAFVVVKVFFDGKQKYTDFLNLYRFDSGWKIIAKTYYSHF